MEAQRLSNQPEHDNLFFKLSNQPEHDNLFFKPLHLHRNNILIPRWFTKLYGQQLKHNALLQDPAGNAIFVSIYGHRNRRWFGKSIRILRIIYKLQSTAWIKFTYVQPGEFAIKVYDSNHKEIEYPAQLINNSKPIHQIQKGMHTDQPGVPVDYDRIKHWNEMIIPGKHGQLTWKSILSPEEIKGTSEKKIPSKIAKELFPTMPPRIDVLLPDGTWKQWDISWNTWSRQSGYFDNCWTKFCKHEFDNTCTEGGQHNMYMWRKAEPDTYGVHIEHWPEQDINNRIPNPKGEI